MYKRLRNKISEFINSEEGKVGVKTSLSFGLVGGGLLLMQTMFPLAAKAGYECWSNDNCADDEKCVFFQDEYTGEWYSECVDV